MALVRVPSENKHLFDSQGYVLIPSLFSPAFLDDLRAACTRVVDRTRAGHWPHRRIVGKQFPPFDHDGNPDSWGVQHLMHPDLGEPVFAKYYTSEGMKGAVRELLEVGDEELMMELFNLLINPVEHNFALRWHRDDINEKATEEEERAALSVWQMHGVQWNTALYEDHCLYVVPGTHKVPRTAEQRAHSSTGEAPNDPLDMPGAIQVVLQPGDTLFYNSNILHCATYDCTATRATLHATMGCVAGGPARARNILQHGLRWMKEERFVEGLDPAGKAMVGRIVELQEKTGEVGYSLDG